MRLSSRHKIIARCTYISFVYYVDSDLLLILLDSILGLFQCTTASSKATHFLSTQLLILSYIYVLSQSNMSAHSGLASP